MKGSKATEKIAENWERGLFKVKSHKKPISAKKFKSLQSLDLKILS